ncbi:ATP-binding protein [Paenibacillus alkaliterrae]|uniref:ATP-binding protein n=1 Tax=Paenibacillus alkaliterrae TaxID=320909 RepID=UPI001F31E6E5|nr:ATP-binding protein [Paenibacillus alkaliterrae]MCF2941598.1 ATP-binding protein [Paenibacillus alkaliterrae]
MIPSSFPLTEHINVTSGAHILYTYDQLDFYIENAVAFIQSGLQLGQHILYVDNKDRSGIVMDKLKELGYGHSIPNIKYMNSSEFYMVSEIFTARKVLQKFTDLLKPLLDSGIPIRAWGHVDWKDDSIIDEELTAYECECDDAANRLGVLAVCAFSSIKLSASLHLRLMESHEYIMTDKQLTRSSLYNRTGNTVIFPSLSEHTKIQDEMDLYKKKLDFVQVISHEVRNPLTVIKAYASMLLNETESLQLNAGAVKKLSDIADYVAVIDNEIAHILNTEQMLSSEALWQTSEIPPLPILQEVVAMMETKARTQNIQLNYCVNLSGQETMNSNATGLRLIISNLLSNAVKYSYEDSQVRFQADCSDGMLRIEIEDQGVGMSLEQQENLYRKYEKMNVDKSGQGIGLFMVKKLVDHFGGDIHISSEVGRGTLARVGLPLKN